MNFEIGIQPNCSELVVRFNHSRTNDILQILRDLERATCWRVGVTLYSDVYKRCAFPVDYSKVRVSVKNFDFSVRFNTNDIITDKILYYMLKHDFSLRELRLLRKDGVQAELIPYNRFVCGENITYGLNIFKEPEGMIKIEGADHYDPHFEVLVRLLRAYKHTAKWCSEGGSPEYFLDWCKKRKLIKFVESRFANE